MFKRAPDTRRTCPVCGKRVNEQETRYCDHCFEDITGTVGVAGLDVAIGDRAPDTLPDLLRRLQGRYVAVNVRDSEKYAAVLLLNVRSDYFTISTNQLLVHFPLSAVVSVVECEGHPLTASQRVMPTLQVHHEYIPKGEGTWFGVSVPLG